MQPAVRACVQSSKRAETTKGSRDCNITEFFKKCHGERVLHHLQRAKILEQEKKIVTKPLLNQKQCFRWDDSPFFILQAVHDI